MYDCLGREPNLSVCSLGSFELKIILKALVDFFSN